MENRKSKIAGILDTESFGEGGRRYYFDIKKAKNDKRYLRITRTDSTPESAFARTHIILFEDDLGFFVEAVTMLLGRYTRGQLGVSC